jgi:hypothetical protein
MARDMGAFRTSNPCPRFGWLTCAAIVGNSLALGSLVLGRLADRGGQARSQSA